MLLGGSKVEKKDKKKIFELVEWRKILKCTNGILKNYYWKPLVELLTKNEEDTTKFLGECSEEQIYWISEVFDEISDKFQSKEFVEFLKRLQVLYSNIDIELDVQAAEYRLEE